MKLADRHQLRDHLAVAPRGLGVATAVLEIPPGMVSDRLEPAAEAARRVVGESAKFLSEFHEDDLGQVLGVGVL